MLAENAEFDAEKAIAALGLYSISDLDTADVSRKIEALAEFAASRNDLECERLKACSIDALKSAGIGARVNELRKAIKQARKRVAAERRRGAAGSEAWESQLATNERGCTASTANLIAILQNSQEWFRVLALDERSGRLVFRNAPPFIDGASSALPREVRDSDYVRMAQWFERSKYAITLSPRSESLYGAAQVVGEQQSFDPVCEYLNTLRWDGTPRLDTLAAVYFGASVSADPSQRERETRYLAAVSAKFMISAVARADKPGCKTDTVTVFIGPQGIGKSTGVRLLAGDAYFADSLPDLHSKDASDYLRGPWIIELSELEALTRAELTTIKAFLSRVIDRYRAAYGRTTESHPRRCIFVATTNQDAFLRDSTGNRRFWPITVTRVDLAAIARDRDQLWAEAVHRYREGEPWHLTDDEAISAATEAQAAHSVVDVWQSAIEAYVAGKTQVALADVMTFGVGLELERCTPSEQSRVAASLRQLGWERRRLPRDSEGKRPWAYFPGGPHA